MAIVPSQCGVRKCTGKVRKINEQRYQCLEKAHHHCFLVVAAAGGEEYEWTTRGWMHLKGKLAPSLSSEAKGSNESVEKPVGEKPALAESQIQKVVESNIPQQPAEKQDAAATEALVSIDEAEIVVPTSSPPTRRSSKETVGQKVNETDTVQVPEKSPTKTPPKTLLQKKRVREASKESSDSGCKKPRSLDLVESTDTPPKTIKDNVKKTSCEICEKPRSANQRGAACPCCLYALRQVAGHQSVQACRDDPSLLSKVKAFTAGEVQKGDRPKRSKDTVETRLDRVEDLLSKLLDHLRVGHV